MALKVVLREHVEHLGERGEIVSVAPGYARNYLLPKGLALEATPGNLKTIGHQHRIWAVRGAKELAEAEALAERVGQLTLVVTKKAGETGTLFGSVTTAEIAQLLAVEGDKVDRRRIVSEQAIKSVGSFEVPVKLHSKVTAHVKLEVVAEKQEKAD